MGDTQYTAEQVESAIGTALNLLYRTDDVEREDWRWEDLDWEEVNEQLGYGTDSTLTTNIGVVRHVASDGGEGQGDDIWFVVRVEDTDQLFKKSGYYASHYGTDWDGPFEEVKAVERTVVFYE